MRTILHILTRPEDEVTRELIARQRAQSETKVEVVDLANGTADYERLLEMIFAADSVSVA